MRVSKITVGDAPLSIQSYFSNGQPSDLVASLAQVPEVLTAATPFISQMMGPSALSMRCKEIVILGTSALQGCRYCTDTHTFLAHQCGLTQGEIQVLRGESSETDTFDAPEKALWAYVQVMAAGALQQTEISAVMDALQAHWLDFEVVEITMLIGTTIMLNRYCTAIGIPVSQTHQQWLAEQVWIDS